jgi:GxxExxY protein
MRAWKRKILRGDPTAEYAEYAEADAQILFAYFACFAVDPHYWPTMNSELLFKDESYKIIGACFELYREKGCGFLEPVYQECTEIELRLQGIPFVAQRPLPLEYKGAPLRCKYDPHFVCYKKIVVELKAVKELADEHRAQVQNYLRATGFQLAAR